VIAGKLDLYINTNFPTKTLPPPQFLVANMRIYS